MYRDDFLKALTKLSQLEMGQSVNLLSNMSGEQSIDNCSGVLSLGGSGRHH